jgi:Zn-dependent M28 family amino/carboxypeptidase
MSQPESSQFEAPLAERLRKHVDMLAEVIGTRHVGEPKKLAATAGYIEREFIALDDTVERQDYDVEGTTVTNLIVERLGKRKPDSIVVLGAHYDSTPSTPGADDNASAVAVLIEVARLLRGRDGQRTVRFVAFTCEEPPYFFTSFMGSRVYANRCRTRAEKILGMLCLEMVGYYTDKPHSQQLPGGLPRWARYLFPHRGNFLAAVGNLRSKSLSWHFRRGFKAWTRFPLFSICFPESISEIRLSDNNSFWEQGYSALMLTDTSFLRNPHYHDRSDRADTLDYARMAQVSIGVAGAVARLAGIAGKPNLG